MPRASTKKAIQRDTLKNTLDKSKWYSKICSWKPREAGKLKQRNKKRAFSTNGVGVIRHLQAGRINLDLSLSHDTKINSIWIMDLNGKRKTTKL